MPVTDSKLSEQKFSKILDYISQKTGIVPIEAHKDGIRKFIESRISILTKSLRSQNEFSYLDFITTNNSEKQLLIDAATVNETYFFREQKQFEFLKQEVFPKIAGKKGSIKIWSAACSSGQEPYSLQLMADSMSIKTEITASDINTLALEKCRNGIYKKSSVKSFDGNLFNHMLNKYWQENAEESGAYILPEEIKSKINFTQLNLMNLLTEKDLESFPKNQDIIFARNVFIYFTRETKQKILKQLAEKCLADGGYLFVSMNETAGIDKGILPECLERKSSGSVFYFQKKPENVK